MLDFQQGGGGALLHHPLVLEGLDVSPGSCLKRRAGYSVQGTHTHTLTSAGSPRAGPGKLQSYTTPPPTRQPQGAGTPVSFADLESSLCSMELSPNIWLPPGQGSH